MVSVFGPGGKLYTVLKDTGEVRAYSAALDGSFDVVRRALDTANATIARSCFFYNLMFGSTDPSTLAYRETCDSYKPIPNQLHKPKAVNDQKLTQGPLDRVIP